jgi:hypothetical protein
MRANEFLWFRGMSLALRARKTLSDKPPAHCFIYVLVIVKTFIMRWMYGIFDKVDFTEMVLKLDAHKLGTPNNSHFL